jgi:hypothetical protein
MAIALRVDERVPAQEARLVEQILVGVALADQEKRVSHGSRLYYTRAVWILYGPRTIEFRAPDGLEAYRTFYAILMLTRGIAE